MSVIITDQTPTPSSPIERFAFRLVALTIVAIFTAVIIYTMSEPDHVSGKVSNDGGVEAKND